MNCFCSGFLAQGGKASGTEAEEVKAIMIGHHNLPSHFGGGILTNKGLQVPLKLEYKRFCLSRLQNGRNGIRSFTRIEATQRADIKIKLGLAESTGKLDLSECEIEEIPEEVFNLTHLEELSLAGNNLVPGPKSLVSITSIDFSEVIKLGIVPIGRPLYLL